MKIYPALNRQHILTLSSTLIPRVTSRIVYTLRFQPGTTSTLSNLSEVIFSLHSCTESICTWLVSLLTISLMLLYRNQGFLLTWSVFGFAFPVSLSDFEPGSHYYVAQACSNSWCSCFSLMSTGLTNGLSHPTSGGFNNYLFSCRELWVYMEVN